MKKRALTALLCVTIGFTLAACSGDSGDDASTGETATSATTATSAPVSSTITTAAAQTFLIAPDGLGLARFGDPAEATLAKLKEKLGQPDQEISHSECEPEITRSLEWNRPLVNFGSGFVGYLFVLSGEGGPELRTEAGIGKGSTVAELKVAYGSKVTLEPGEEGTQFKTTLPTGVLQGVAFGPEDADDVGSFFAGAVCGE